MRSLNERLKNTSPFPIYNLTQASQVQFADFSPSSGIYFPRLEEIHFGVSYKQSVPFAMLNPSHTKNSYRYTSERGSNMMQLHLSFLLYFCNLSFLPNFISTWDVRSPCSAACFVLPFLPTFIMPSQRHLTWRLWINRTISLFVNQLSANT